MQTSQLRIYERTILGLLLVGPVLGVAGIAALVAAPELYRDMSIVAAAIGVILSSIAIGLSHPIATFRTVMRRGSGGTEYDQLRYMGHLKASALLLNLLWLLGVVGLVLGLLNRLQTVEITASYQITLRVAALGAVAILLNLTHVLHLSLRIPVERVQRYPVVPFLFLGLAVTLLFAVFSIALTDRSFQLGGALAFGARDAPLFLLGAIIFASMTLVIARPIPNLLSLFREGRGLPSARDYISKTKSILLPAVTAFALLFLVLFLLLVVGVGTTGIQSPVQLGVFVFIGIAMLLSVFFSVRLAKSQDTAELYKVKVSPETRAGRLVLYISLSMAVLVGLGAMWLLRGGHIWFLASDRWVDLLSAALLIALGPYGFYVSRRLNRIRRLEERFPDFLRDVAASHRGGLTLTAAVQIASKGEYGELTPEIRKMADQLSWNVPFNEALRQMMERVRTPLVERAITLIIEASRSGGSTTDVLLAAARDAREIKNLENERRTTMSLYTVIIYVTFFVFLGVAAVLYGQFVPELIRSAEAAAAAGEGGAGIISIGIPAKTEYRSFYFLAAVVQGIGNGLVGGLFQSGKVLAGLRHAFLMVLITYVTFTFIFP